MKFNNSGLTLAEILIALLLLSVATVGMYHVFYTGRFSDINAELRMEALAAAEQTLEKLRNFVRDEYGPFGSDWQISGDAAGAVWALSNSAGGVTHTDPLTDEFATIRDQYGGVRSYVVASVDTTPGVNSDGLGGTEDDTDCYRVTVTVTWTAPE